MTSARDNLRTVAMRLDDLGLQDVVFVGGATIGMLITDEAAPEPRATLDVDAVTGIDSRKAFNELEGRLRASGYHQPERGPICRWIIDGVTVDLMPLEESILGFSNRWYPDLLNHAQTYRLDDVTIRLASAPYLLATKLEAFRSRGNGDYRMSRDIEDLIILVDGRRELADEVRRAPEDVQGFLRTEIARLLADEAFTDQIAEHLPPDTASQARSAIILERLEAIREAASEARNTG